MNPNESTLENVTLDWFRGLGYAVAHGSDLAPGEAKAERASYGDVVLSGRLRTALHRLNPGVPPDALEEAFRQVMLAESPSLVSLNRRFHSQLMNGISVECHPSPPGRGAGGEGLRWEHVKLIDFDDPTANDWLALNQLTVVENHHNRRMDVVVYVNGLPLALLELKNPGDENADIWKAFNQVQTYKREIPSLFRFNELLVVSDGLNARIGSLTASREWFKRWRSVDGAAEAPGSVMELETLVEGVFQPRRFLDLILGFVAFEVDRDNDQTHKLLAGYHQFHAVRVAVRETLRASGMGVEEDRVKESTFWAGEMEGGKRGDRRAGVVWHTQGSGKSLSMLFYAASVIRHPAMKNPTVVVITDRNDLDDQLFGQFQRCEELLRQTPIQAADRSHLRSLLNRASGGVIFTTMQKFAPLEPSPRPSPSGRGSEDHYRGGFDFAGFKERARDMRKNQTPAEDMLWDLLRNRQQNDAKFRRQHQFGEYICDFYCAEAKLAVECDGAAHLSAEAIAHDKHRDAYLKSQGVTVLRFENSEVLDQTEQVLATICSHLPSPSGRGAGGEGNVAQNESMTCLSDRSNIVVIADEAHRSQYGLIAGFARNLRDALPNASYIGFTGTPIEKTDANTRAVFGEYVSVYDIERAVEDESTVPIYYESRIAKLSLNEQALQTMDDEFDAITEDEEGSQREKLKSKWAALEALVGEEKRVALIARDLVAHFERRREAMEGKAMVVCMSRRICVDLYNALVALRPDWAGAGNDDPEAEREKDCVVKIVMTGSASDPPDWQQHIRGKKQRRDLANRFKKAKDPFRIVLVRDMWLTGFDAPCLHTLYVDKPMQGHGLMQAIARVNRVFRDKPGGLVVDYLGLADQLKKALAVYTESGGKGRPTYDTAQAVAVMLEKFEVCCAMLHPLEWQAVWHGTDSAARVKLLPEALDHVLGLENGKPRFVQAVTDLSRAFALCATSPEAEARRDDIAFFQQLRGGLMKRKLSDRSPEEMDAAIRQLISSAIVPGEEVIDVFTAAGLERPDISILSAGFLAEVQGMKHKNVAAELLERLLKDEVKAIRKSNVVQGDSFSEKLQKAVNAYHNRAISSQEIIEELIKLAKEMQAANERGENMGLHPDEVAFYDALANNESAVKAMGNDELKVIAAELVTKVRQSVTIDWTVRENARARIRVMVRRILNKHGYPPDLQEEAVQTVLRQAEALCGEWVG